jgi:hypothetical protein
VAVEQLSDEKVKLYASWNGATEVESWELLAGSDAGRLEPVGSVPRDGEVGADLRFAPRCAGQKPFWSGSGHKRAGYHRR